MWPSSRLHAADALMVCCDGAAVHPRSQAVPWPGRVAATAVARARREDGVTVTVLCGVETQWFPVCELCGFVGDGSTIVNFVPPTKFRVFPPKGFGSSSAVVWWS